MNNKGDEPFLVIEGGPNDGVTIPVEESTLKMGRLRDNDVAIDEPVVSRRHAEIVGTATGFYLRDLGSTNGTFVNEQNIGTEEHLLGDGDKINLGNGDVSLVFRHFAAATLRMTMLQPASGGVEAGAGQLVDEVGVSEQSPDASDEEIYEGTVKLKVESDGDIQLVVNFVKELRQQSQLRVLRLVSHSQTDMEISLGVREPLRLRQLLGEIQGVSQVSPAEGQGVRVDERLLNVRLAV